MISLKKMDALLMKSNKKSLMIQAFNFLMIFFNPIEKYLLN